MSLQSIKKADTGQKFRLGIISYRKRLLDKDNLYGAHKVLIDALCDEGFIWDDDPGRLVLTVTQRVANKSSGEKVRTQIIRNPVDRII